MAKAVDFRVEEDGVGDGEQPVVGVTGDRVPVEAQFAQSGYPVLSELCEYTRQDGFTQWRQLARWVKFEELVEEGGNRWSKPFVPSPSLHSIFQVRSCVAHGAFVIDVDVDNYAQLVELIADKLSQEDILDPNQYNEFCSTLHATKMHQYMCEGQKVADPRLLAVRGLSPTPSSGSFANAMDLIKSLVSRQQLSQKDVQSMTRKATKFHLTADVLEQYKPNLRFYRKLRPGTEAFNIMVGEVDFLHNEHLSVFVRIKHSLLFDELTEVPTPTRFLFILLGPGGKQPVKYKAVGRAFGTIMSDEIFREAAYEAGSRADMLAAIDQYMDQITTLPPSVWDPNVRIEPPKALPKLSQRKNLLAEHEALLNAWENADNVDDFDAADKRDEPEGGGHGDDPTLQRTGRLFGGLANDVRRKLPHYISDYRDALNAQCIAAAFFMFFSQLAPIVTFGGLLELATGQRMAAMENLLSGALCGVTWHIFAGQPLTVIGSTGPVLVFEAIIFGMCHEFGISYLTLRFWINFWMGTILFIIVATDMSALVRYITRFTEECFATLIAVIFIVEAFKKLAKIYSATETIEYVPPGAAANGTCSCDKNGTEYRAELCGPERIDGKLHFYQTEGDACRQMFDVFLMSVILMLGTYSIAVTLKAFRNAPFFPTRARAMISDFAVIIAIVVMIAVDALFQLDTPKLNVPNKFRPTWEGRGWVVNPMANELWTIPLAFIPAILGSVLLFMDQHITAVIVNRKENKLKKGAGYHLDLLVISIHMFVTGILGIPIYVAATVLAINHVNALRVQSESQAPGEPITFVGCREQRVTGIVCFLLIGLSVFMTPILKYVPMPVLYGVFLYMGITPLSNIQFIDRILLLFMPKKHQPDSFYLRDVTLKRVHLFTLCQVLCFSALWVVKSIKMISITFPLMLVFMVGVRKLMEYMFTRFELGRLDDIMPDLAKRKKHEERVRKESLAVTVAAIQHKAMRVEPAARRTTVAVSGDDGDEPPPPQYSPGGVIVAQRRQASPVKDSAQRAEDPLLE